MIDVFSRETWWDEQQDATQSGQVTRRGTMRLRRKPWPRNKPGAVVNNRSGKRILFLVNSDLSSVVYIYHRMSLCSIVWGQ